MSPFMAMNSEPWMQQVGWVLVHFIWQGAILAWLLAAVLHLSTTVSSRARYGIIAFALLLSGMMPVVTWTTLQSQASWLATPRPATVIPSVLALSASVVPIDHSVTATPVGPALYSGGSWWAGFSRLLGCALPCLVVLWLVGVLILTGRLTLGWLWTQKLCGDGSRIRDAECLIRFRHLLERMRVDVPVRLLQSALVEVPTLIGWLRPTILIPAWAFTGLTPDQLETILAHELAHVRRLDYLVNLFQTVIEIILFYHPAIWWISQKLREEREHCCDDDVLEVMRDRLLYASALAQLEVVSGLSPRCLVMTATGGSLLERIQRIAGVKERKMSAWPLVLLATILGVLCLTHICGLFPRKVVKTGPITASSRQSTAAGEQLIEAADRGDLTEMKRLLKRGTDVNYRGIDDWTPLTKAAVSGKTGSVKLLLANGADPNSTKTNWEYNALCFAQKADIADLLVSAGAKLDAPMCMRYSVSYGKPEKVQWLIARGCDPSKLPGGPPGENLLSNVRNPQIAELLIQHGVEVNARSKYGVTALDSVCFWEKHPVEIVRVLLRYGADPNARDRSGNTPLSYAQDGATVELLIQHGADLKAKNKYGFGVLNYRGDASQLETLIRHGVPFDPTMDGPTLLTYAAKSGNIEVISYLLKLGVDPNLKGLLNKEADFHLTPLEVAVSSGKTDAARLLLDHGAKVAPPLYLNRKLVSDVMASALLNRREAIVKLFWERGGRSISELTYAISQGAPLGEIKKCLDSGILADPSRDKSLSPLGVAALLGRLDVVELLVQRGAVIEHDGIMGGPLGLAAREGQDKVVDFLLRHGARVQFEVLDNAVYNCNPDPDQLPKENFEKCVKLLIDAGTLKKLTPEQGGRILAAAIETRNPGGNSSVLKSLLDAGLRPDLPFSRQSGKTSTVITYFRKKYDQAPDDRWAFKSQLEILETAAEALR